MVGSQAEVTRLGVQPCLSTSTLNVHELLNAVGHFVFQPRRLRVRQTTSHLRGMPSEAGRHEVEFPKHGSSKLQTLKQKLG